jgi:hypothetical protein
MGAHPVPTAPKYPIFQSHTQVLTESMSEVKDWEDPEDETSWARCPGKKDRYRCNHREMRCLEQICKGANHRCCKNGIDRATKLKYLVGELEKKKRKTKSKE